MKLFLDSFVVSSFWLHFLCLCLLKGQIPEQRGRSLKRVALAAAACSVMDVLGVCCLPLGRIGLRLLASAAELLAASAMAFGRRRLWKRAAGLLLMSMLLGGCFSILRLKNTGLFCCIGGGLFLLMEILQKEVQGRKAEQSYTYTALLSFQEESRSFSAFLDSGNRLKLYGSRLPVLVAKEECIRDWIRRSQTECPQNSICLPFHGIGGKGLLFGVRVDCRVTKETGETVYYGKAAAVGTDGKLFYGRDYELLLQPEFLEPSAVGKSQ